MPKMRNSKGLVPNLRNSKSLVPNLRNSKSLVPNLGAHAQPLEMQIWHSVLKCTFSCDGCCSLCIETGFLCGGALWHPWPPSAMQAKSLISRSIMSNLRNSQSLVPNLSTHRDFQKYHAKVEKFQESRTELGRSCPAPMEMQIRHSVLKYTFSIDCCY